MNIRIDGPITSGTKRNLATGVHSSPMKEDAVEGVFEQTVRVADRLTALYSEEVASGEVGIAGTAIVGTEAASGGSPPTSLLYGRVQSGKTVSMILTAALCLDNGFRVVVVLTSDNVALVKQTALRFKDLADVRVFAGVKEGARYEWEGQEDRLAHDAATVGMVLVCAKNSTNLPEVIRFLKRVGAAGLPVLVLDDEADAATPDTTLAARTAHKPKAPSVPSRIYRLVIENTDPGEFGFSLGQEFPHSLYVQVTATPYVLFLQRENSPIRPADTFLLEPGNGYCGGGAFFGDYDPSIGAATPTTLVMVDPNEASTIDQEPPTGLLSSIEFFLLSACARSLSAGWPKDGFNHLSHTSPKTSGHDRVAGYIRARLSELGDVLKDTEAASLHFLPAYAELIRSLSAAPTLDVLLAVCRRELQHAEVIRVNSKVGPPAYGPRLNFLVGGNILGRGLTIPDLLVTYYVREAKVSQMDTVWQHARMFGYRAGYLDHMRVYLPPQLATRFRGIHEGEEALRRSIADGDGSEARLIRLPSASRATRPNTLDAAAIRGITAGREQVNAQKVYRDPKSGRQFLRLFQSVGGRIDPSASREDRPFAISVETALRLVDAVPVATDDAGVWDRAVVTALIRSYAASPAAEMLVYVRELVAGDETRTRGRLSGQEISLLRGKAPEVPSLALLYVGAPDAPDGWYPTLVMPAGSPAFVFEGG